MAERVFINSIIRFLVCLLQVKGIVTQCLIGRVHRSESYAIYPNQNSGAEFFVPRNQSVEMYCYCQSFSRVKILHRDVILSQGACSTLLYPIQRANYSHEGEYVCQAEMEDGNSFITPLGNMTVFDADAAVQAEPQQNGYRNTSSELHCSTTASSDVSVTITWFRGQGENRTQLEGVPIFNITELVHAGIYTCQVYFSQKDIRIEKLINFTVIDALVFALTTHTNPGTPSITTPTSGPVTPPTTTIPSSDSLATPTATPTDNDKITPQPRNSQGLVIAAAVLGSLFVIVLVAFLILSFYIAHNYCEVHTRCLSRENLWRRN